MGNQKGNKARSWPSIVGMVAASCFLVSSGGFAAVMLMNLHQTIELRTPLDRAASFSGRLGVCNEPVFYTKDRANLYVIDGLFNGRPMRYLFDTGASKTSISMAQVGAHDLEISGRMKKEIVITAAGEVEAYVIERQEISIAGHQVTIDALLLPGLGEAILGMDVIEKFKTTIDPNGLSILKDC